MPTIYLHYYYIIRLVDSIRLIGACHNFTILFLWLQRLYLPGAMKSSLGNWHSISASCSSRIQHFITCHAFWMHTAWTPLEDTAQVHTCIYPSPCHSWRLQVMFHCYGSFESRRLCSLAVICHFRLAAELQHYLTQAGLKVDGGRCEKRGARRATEALESQAAWHLMTKLRWIENPEEVM